MTLARGLIPCTLLVCLALPAGARHKRGDWPMVRKSPEGNAVTSLDLPGGVQGHIRPWQFQASSHVWGYQPGMSVWSSAAVGKVKGRAVVLAGSYDGNLYALDALQGHKLWRFTTGGGIYSPPALWTPPGGEALVFVASSDRLVYALDADLGRQKWVYAIKTWRPTMGGARLSAPCVGRVGAKEAVFVGHWVWDKSISGHLQAGGLSALAARTGRLLWTSPLGDAPVSSPIFAPVDGAGRIFVGSENGNLYSLSAKDGKVLWSFTDRNAIKGHPAFFQTPSGPRVVFGSKYAVVRCLDARTGRQLWHFKTGHWVDGSPTVAHLGPDRDVVLVGSYDNQLYALSALTGHLIWRYATAAPIYSTPAVVRHDGRHKVLLSGWDHHLHCVDAEDGSLLWSAYLGRPLWDSITLGDSIWSSPSVAEINGEPVVYLGTYAGPFYAIPLAEAESQALARPGSNLTFWITLPLVLVATMGLTRFLTHRHRRRQVLGR